MKAANNRPPIEIKSPYLLFHFHLSLYCSCLHISFLPTGHSKIRNSKNMYLLTSRTLDKAEWISNERNIWAKLYSVPLISGAPPDFPPFTLPIMRNMCALTTLSSDQEKLCKALDALYHAYWVEGKLTHQPDAMKEVLSSVLGEEEAAKRQFHFFHFFFSVSPSF
jgi:hypothetical protein